MRLIHNIKSIFLIGFFSISITANAATLEQTIMISLASGGLCKIYAEEVGGDVEAFKEMNQMILLIADKMGYTKNFNSYITEVREFREFIGDKLLDEHKTKSNVYNNWCIRFYNGMVDEMERWQ